MNILNNPRKVSVIFIISIFVLSMLATANPVRASFTLGDLTGTYRYHANDFDPHIPGVIGYVGLVGVRMLIPGSRTLRT